MKQLPIFFLFLSIFLLGGVGFLATFGEEWPMTVYESKSPTNDGLAVFVDESSIKDTITKFYVRDSACGQTLWSIGTFDSDDSPMGEIVWSGDGSIVATRSVIYRNHTKSYGSFFTTAYDFKNHRRFIADKDIRPFSSSIHKLIQHRGGQIAAKLSPREEISFWKWNRKRYKPPAIEHEPYEPFTNGKQP